jgi:hypothetical protein
MEPALTSKEVLIHFQLAQEKLEASAVYKQVQHLTSLYTALSNKEYENEIKQIKAYYTTKGYECRDISNCEIELSKECIDFEDNYNFIVIPTSTPEIKKLILNKHNQDIIIFKNGSKLPFSDVVIGNSHTELGAWDDIYVSIIDRESITKNMHRYS